MDKPTIFIVKKEQVGNQDINEFLRNALSKEFGENDLMIMNEVTLDSVTHYSRTPRKLKGYSINTKGGAHTIYFDITDASSVNQDKNSWRIY
jgi:hypothetical protein